MSTIPYKSGTCSNCGGKDRHLINKLCITGPVFCYQKAQSLKAFKKQQDLTVMRNSLKDQKPIKKVSVKQVVKNREYQKLKAEYMINHPLCEFTGCTRLSNDLHHKKSRKYFLCDTTVYMATCREHHDWIHSHDAQARELGYLQSALEI